MEYSLSTFTNKSNLGNLNLNEVINKLNLVGFEVDEVSFEKSGSYSQDIKFLLKLSRHPTVVRMRILV
jgi:hypothetical protein